jgi:hypothetical protein
MKMDWKQLGLGVIIGYAFREAIGNLLESAKKDEPSLGAIHLNPYGAIHLNPKGAHASQGAHAVYAPEGYQTQQAGLGAIHLNPSNPYGAIHLNNPYGAIHLNN